MTQKRIGILGGTFNPIHIGHLILAEVSQQKLKLNQVIFVPSCLPPHKKDGKLALAQHRYEMVKRAIQGNPKFIISDFEIHLGGKSYSIKTVKHFHRKFNGDTKLFFLIGQDSLKTLHLWKDIDQIRKIVQFVVINRGGYVSQNPKAGVLSITVPAIDISSSYIRQMIRLRKSVRYFVPPPVLAYMLKNKLYQ